MAIHEHASAARRLQLAFRVGISGTRHIEPAALPEIRRQIEQILRHVAKTVGALGTGPDVGHIYRHDADGPIRPRLRAISPLADGTDRLFAEVAAQLQPAWEIDVALPFARDEYARDFDDASRADYDRWLGGPDAPGARPYLAIDGGRGDEENRSYEAVGRVVVRNCDLLIAVWDGHPAKGRGGTGDIVRFSAKFGPPVWWIDAEGHEVPRLIKSSMDLRSREHVPGGEAALTALTEMIRALVLPPTIHHRARPHGIIGSFAHKVGVRDLPSFDPLQAYLAEEPRPQRLVWQTHGRFFRLISGPPPKAPDEPDRPKIVFEPGFWTEQYERADRASIDYGNRYRSSYILVFALATLAVAFAVSALALPPVKAPATFAELLSLAAITGIVYLNQKRDWQGRWISYRFLAELCRKQDVLSLLGWSLPASDLRRFGGSGSPAPWVGWFFDALLRAAPFASGDLRGERLAYIRNVALAKLISGQATYHFNRKHVSAVAARKLAKWGEYAFLFTTGIVALKLTPLSHYFVLGKTMGIVAAILPALSAAFVGIRAYSEVELLEQQSARLEETMKEADKRVRHLQLERTLASQDLAADIYEISAAMLQDVNGWADLFLLKAVEAG